MGANLSVRQLLSALEKKIGVSNATATGQQDDFPDFDIDKAGILEPASDGGCGLRLVILGREPVKGIEQGPLSELLFGQWKNILIICYRHKALEIPANQRNTPQGSTYRQEQRDQSLEGRKQFLFRQSLGDRAQPVSWK